MKKELDQQVLRERLRKSGKTIQQVAEGTGGISYSTIGNFRRGLNISPMNAEKIEAYLTREGK